MKKPPGPRVLPPPMYAILIRAIIASSRENTAAPVGALLRDAILSYNERAVFTENRTMLSFSPIAKMDLGLPDDIAGDLKHYHNVGNRSFPHYHPELEINLVLAGKATYLLGERRYELTANTLVWLFPGQTHILTEKSADLEMWIGLFRPVLTRLTCRTDSGRLLTQGDPDGDYCRRLAPLQTRRLTRLFEDVVAGRANLDLFNAGMAYALQSTWDAYGHADQAPQGTCLHPAVRKAVAALCREDSAGVAEIARDVNLSPSRLSELFNLQIGMSMAEFRSRQRLTRFMQLYEDGTGRTLLGASLDAGFGSYLQFYRVFRRLMGCGPAEYRRERHGAAE